MTMHICIHIKKVSTSLIFVSSTKVSRILNMILCYIVICIHEFGFKGLEDVKYGFFFFVFFFV